MWQRAGSEHRVRPRTLPRSRQHRIAAYREHRVRPHPAETRHRLQHCLQARARTRATKSSGRRVPAGMWAKRDAIYAGPGRDVAKRDAIHVQAACGGRRHSWTPLTRWRVVPAQMCWQHRRCGAGTSRPKHPQVQQPVLALFMHACARIDGCAAQLRTRSALLHAHSVDAT